MNNLFLIESNSLKLAEIKIKDILRQNNFSIDDLIKYDLNITNIENVIEDLDTYGLFNNKKIIYAFNANFLTREKCDIDHKIEVFEKYINNPNQNSILILSCLKVDGTKNIGKLVKKKFINIDTNIDLIDYSLKKMNSYKISSLDLKYLIEITNNNFDALDNEIDKLICYKIDSKEIKRNDIDLIVLKKIDDNIYNFIDAILKKNKKLSLEMYNEMINYGTEVYYLITMISNQIRMLYQAKVLNNFDNNELKDALNLKSASQSAAIKYKSLNYSSTELLDSLYKLAVMDEKLKKGEIIDKIAFPLFIASL